MCTANDHHHYAALFILLLSSKSLGLIHRMEQSHPASELLEELDLLQRHKAPDQSKPNRRSMLCNWKWKLVRFLDGIRRRRSHCVVCIQIYQIDGLPTVMDGQVLVVGWKTKGCKGEHTLPVHVCQGNASFDEIFLHYCSRDVESALKSFTIWASLVDAADCDLGTFGVDLTELAAAENSNSLLRGKTASFILGGLASGGALRLSVFCWMMDEESNDFNHLIGQKQGKGKCFSCLPDLGCRRSSPVTFCARRIPSLRSDHGFITIENSIAEYAPPLDEDCGFITIEKSTICSRTGKPPSSDHLANTDDDESSGVEDEKPCFVVELNDELDGAGVEDEFLRMMEEKCCSKAKDGRSLSLSLDLGAHLDLETLIKEAEMELEKGAYLWKSRAAAALLEKQEYEELMKRWASTGISAPECSGVIGFGSPL